MNDPQTINGGLVIIIPKEPAYERANNIFPDETFITNSENAIAIC
ncbi:hypothetical protein [Brumimicrobium glaciale]|nr:hypothetical protein [Brumimicrobium glaciale]